MTLTGIDHLVIAVPDLERAAEGYRRLGFTVVAGGKHPPSSGTHNALVAFADGAYLELLAFYQDNPLHRWWEALQQGGGLIDYCLQTDDLAADTDALREAGVELDNPVARSRQRPDGYEVRWVFSVPREAHSRLAPFIIADETPRGERVPRQTDHPNGVVGIGTLTVAVDDLPTVRGWYSTVLGQRGHEIERADLGAGGVRFRIGPHQLELVAPIRPNSPIRQWLQYRGASPYAATFVTRSAISANLDPADTMGAQLSLVEPNTRD